MNLYSILYFLAAYLIGTIPSAYLAVKMKSGKDIRKIGTGNVGALNSYETTGKKHIGIIVMLSDSIKGCLAVLLVYFAGAHNENYILTGIAVIMGHNYNIFLKFKGGRGLATAVGIFVLLNPLFLILWCLCWLFGYFIINRNVHVGNIAGTVLASFALMFIPNEIYIFGNTLVDLSKEAYTTLSLGISFLILLKHIEPLNDIIRKH